MLQIMTAETCRDPSKCSVWNSFEKINKDGVKCKLCQAKLTLVQLKELYDENACVLRSCLISAEKVSQTTESWTACTTELHVMVTCHCFSNWKIQSAALQTKAMLEQRTAENLANLW